MTLRDLAARVLLCADIDIKLRPVPGDPPDVRRGSPVRVSEPARPAALRFRYKRNGPALPRGTALEDRGRRGIAHHILANHELQAAETMASVLLAFPAAPPDFRRELGGILRDELRHTRMHLARAAACGVRFGDCRVNGHVWLSAAKFRSELEYLAVLPLVFEARNLDESVELAGQFDAAGDARGAAVMRRIHEDEIGHVAFGLRWLKALGGDANTFDLWCNSLAEPNKPRRSVGRAFLEPPRLAAGMDAAFLTKLRAAAGVPA